MEEEENSQEKSELDQKNGVLENNENDTQEDTNEDSDNINR